MIAWFVANQESTFYSSKAFTDIIQTLQVNPRLARMKEHNNRLSLIFQNVIKVQDALFALDSLKSKMEN
jgi:transcription-repair coupling factor (superfamily II helicase)